MRLQTILAVSLAIAWATAVITAPGAAAAAIRDIATDTTDPGNMRDTEPSIAVNPTNPNDIVVVTFAEGWAPGTPAPVWRSNNLGFSWTKSFILPQPADKSGGPGDQQVDFDAGGKLFVAELGLGLTLPDCFIFRQTGLASANLTPGAAYGDDQPQLAVGRSTAHCLGGVHSPWLRTALNFSMIANSADSGVSINYLAAGDARYPNRTTRIALAPDGAVYVIFKLRQNSVAVSLPGSPTNDFEDSQFVVRRSDDCGQTWQPAVSVHAAATVQALFTVNFGDRTRGKVARARSSDAWIAIDPRSGDVYAAFAQRDASGFAQVYVSRSTDRGVTWTTNRVTDGTHHSAYPEIAVAANGAVGVLYIDFDNAGAATIFRHRLARSFDGGVTWTDQILQAMDPGPIANATSGFLWGDYEGLTAQGNVFLGVFTGQSIDRRVLQLDPIFFTESAIQPTKELCLEDCRDSFERCPKGTSACTLELKGCLLRCHSISLPQTPELTVTEDLTTAGDDGRFDLQVDGAVMAHAVGASGATGPVAMSTGVHTVSVSETAGHISSFAHTTTIGGACASDGSVTLAVGDAKTCTISIAGRPLSPRELCLANCQKQYIDCLVWMRPFECQQDFKLCRYACPR
jgi:hypothetical protein